MKKGTTYAASVVATAQRNTAIRVGETLTHVLLIPLDASGLSVIKLSHEEFEAEWGEITYDPKQAAKKYLASYIAGSENTTQEARSLLEDVVSGKLQTKQSTPQGETTMATTKKATKPKKAAPASPKKSAKATKPKAKKPTAKAATRASAGRGYGDRKYKVLIKENPCRPGFCQDQVNALMTSSTIAEAQAKLAKKHERRLEVGWAVSKGYIELAAA